MILARTKESVLVLNTYNVWLQAVTYAHFLIFGNIM